MNFQSLIWRRVFVAFLYGALFGGWFLFLLLRRTQEKWLALLASAPLLIAGLVCFLILARNTRSPYSGEGVMARAYATLSIVFVLCGLAFISGVDWHPMNVWPLANFLPISLPWAIAACTESQEDSPLTGQRVA